MRRYTNAHKFRFDRAQLLNLRLQLRKILLGEPRVWSKRFLVNNATQSNITQRHHAHHRRVARISNTYYPRSHSLTRAPRRGNANVIGRHQLESRARQAAIEAIERAARESDVLERSRRQAERELRALAAGLGTPEVRFEWRAP